MSSKTRLDEHEQEAIGHGRDEMNLAEFPLSTLAGRPTVGQKTLVFEDRIFDQGRGEWVTRRLTISASEKYGLPTALDDEVILGLIQLTKEHRFAERQVSFSRYQLLALLGWRDEGRSYHRLETSLRRWLGVTLYYDKAWWDKASQSWVDESFHFLDQVTIRRRDQAGVRQGKPVGLSSFTWNDVIFRSFQAGNVKQLDWQLFRGLKLPTTKRMYRFLDKRFYHRSLWEFDLRKFACEHIGLARSYDTGQVKRKLMPSVRELEGVSFLEPLPAEQRFVRKGRGDWRIVMQKKRVARVVPPDDEHIAAAALLTERGVAAGVARQLVKAKGAAVIQQQVQAFDAVLRRGSAGALRNPPGFLVAAIKREDLCQHPTQPARVAAPALRSNVAPRPQQLAPHDQALAQWECSSEADRELIAQQALGTVEPFLRRNYEQALARGQTTLAGHYLAGIVARYLSKLPPITIRK